MAEDAASIFLEFGLSTFSIVALIFLALLFSCYVKIVTVLGILRIGLGFYSLPSSFVSGGLALALSFFVMYPTIQESVSAYEGSVRAKGAAVSDRDRAMAINLGIDRWKSFLLMHTHREEAERFSKLASRLDARAIPENKNVIDKSVPQTASDNTPGYSWRVLAPAFLVSELKNAFKTGLSIFLPFLVIDLILSNILVAIGLEQMNPQVVSLPLKLLIFILLDGWSLISTNLISTYLGS